MIPRWRFAPGLPLGTQVLVPSEDGEWVSHHDYQIALRGLVTLIRGEIRNEAACWCERPCRCEIGVTEVMAAIRFVADSISIGDDQ